MEKKKKVTSKFGNTIIYIGYKIVYSIDIDILLLFSLIVILKLFTSTNKNDKLIIIYR